MNKYKYYKTKYARKSASNIFVYLGDDQCYCPVGQHGSLSQNYLLNDCKEISKKEYIGISKGLYTPEDYL